MQCEFDDELDHFFKLLYRFLT